MRVKGIIVLLVIIGLGFIISLLSIDPYIESELEYQASLTNGALVEIDGFDISLTELKIRWDRLQVTNPENTWENSFETGEAELDFLFWPTLWERVIIEDIILKDFKLNTERETNGYFEIPLDEDGEEQEPNFITKAISEVSSDVASNASTEFTNIKADINMDSLMATINLQAPDKIDSLRNNIDQNYQKWDSTFKNTSINAEISGIQKTVDAINVKDIKEIEKVAEALKKVETLGKQVDSLKTKTAAIKSDFQNNLSSSSGGIGEIDKWIQDDLDRALTLAKLPKIDAQNIAQSLFGKELFSDYAGYLSYLAIARDYGSRLTGGEKEEKIPRYEGIDYKFTDKYDWPKFWIKNINLSGETLTAIKLEGIITDISSDQSKTNKPTLININGNDAGTRSLTLHGEMNYLEEQPKELIKVEYQGFNLAGTKLSASSLLPYPLIEGTGRVSANVNFIGKRIDSEIEYINEGLKFDFGETESKNKVQELIKKAVSETDQINVSALVDNVDGPIQVKVRSNIDKLFVDALKSTVSDEVEKARAKIEDEVKSRIGDRKEQLYAFKDEKEAELKKKSEELQTKVESQLKVVENKKEELNKRKKEIEEEIKKKAADALKKKIGF